VPTSIVRIAGKVSSIECPALFTTPIGKSRFAAPAPDNWVIRRGIALTQRIAAVVGLGLATAAVVFFVLAAETAGTDCTFDNFGCRRNQLIGAAVRCFLGGVVAGVAWVMLRTKRKRQHSGLAADVAISHEDAEEIRREGSEKAEPKN
jgi:hypothetical protein